MAIALRASTASQEIPLGYFVDSTDGDTEETGLTIANTDIKLWKAGATTLANKNSGGATHISNGVYYAVLDATDTNTVGPLVVFVHVSGALAVRVECVVYPATVYDSFIAGNDTLPVDVTQWLGTAAATPSVAGVPEVDVTHFSGNINAMSVAGQPDVTATHWSTSGQATTLVGSQPSVALGNVSHGGLGASMVLGAGLDVAGNMTLGSGGTVTFSDTVFDSFDVLGNLSAGNVTTDGAIVSDITGNVSGSVGSVSGTVAGIAGTIQTLDALDTAQDTQHGTTQSAISALNDLSAAQVNAEVDTALADINLDHLLAVAANGTHVVDDSVIAQLVSGNGTADWDSFDNTSDSLQAIRDRGDSAWTTGAGGSPPDLLVSTTIATLASQTSFTLTAGSADDDAYNGALAIVTDQSTSTQKAVGTVSDYVGSTRTVTLGADPGVFTMAVGDSIAIQAVGEATAVVDTAAIADAVLDEALSGHTTAGTLGKAVADIETDATAILADTGTDGVVLAANSVTAAAVAADAVTEIQSGLSTYDGTDTSGTTTLLSRLSATRAGYLDNLQNGNVALESTAQSILTDTAEIGAAGAGLTEAGGTGDHLTGIASVGAVSGAVGSVTGAVGSVTGNVAGVTGNVGGTVAGIAGTLTTLDALDAAQDSQHSTTQAAVAALNDLDAAGVRAAVGLASANLDTQLAAIAADNPNAPTRGVELANFPFLMVDATDFATPEAGLTVAGTISKDGGAFASLTNSVTEIGNGIYKVTLTSTEMTATTIVLRFTATGAADRYITVVTQPT